MVLSFFLFVANISSICKLLNIFCLLISADPEERNNLADSKPDIVAQLVAKLDAAKAEERMPDLASQIPSPAGEASNFGGIWTPGWC